MKISTVIPVYNAEKYIARCLDSILNQGIVEQEIICIDDGSTDNSLKILRNYEETHNNIRVLTQERSYAGMARNNGLLVAKGEYVHFMDADDYVFPGSYLKVYETAKENSVDYVKTRSKVFDMKTETFIQSNYFSMDDYPESIYGQVCSLCECQDVLLKTARAPWTSFVKRSYLLENNIRFNSLKCINDHSFYIDVITHTNRMVICNCYMVCYHTNNNNSLMGIRNENFICHIQSYQLIRSTVSGIAVELKKKILGYEFSSLTRWYAKLNTVQRKAVEQSMKTFLADFNWSELNVCALTASTMDPIYDFLSMKFPHQCRIRDLAVLAEIYQNLQKISLYGAGKVCVELLKYLKNGNYDLNKISYIMVTDKNCNPDYIMGIPVYSVKECDLYCVNGIIIATFESVQVPIYQNLLLHASCNIWGITDSLYTLFSKES